MNVQEDQIANPLLTFLRTSSPHSSIFLTHLRSVRSIIQNRILNRIVNVRNAISPLLNLRLAHTGIYFGCALSAYTLRVLHSQWI